MGNIASFRITVDAAEQVSSELLHMAAVVRDMKPFYRDVFVPEYLADVQRNILSEGDDVGRWPPTSAAYDEWKERIGAPDRMGQLTQKMLFSFSPSRGSQHLRVTTHEAGAMITNTLPHIEYFNDTRQVMPDESQLDTQKYRKLLEAWLEFQFGPPRGLKRRENVFDLVQMADGGKVIVTGGKTKKRKKPAQGWQQPFRNKTSRQVAKLRESMMAKALAKFQQEKRTRMEASAAAAAKPKPAGPRLVKKK